MQPCVLFLISLVLRIVFGYFQNLDYWGDSYSHFLISRNILENGTYYDLKIKDLATLTEPFRSLELQFNGTI